MPPFVIEGVKALSVLLKRNTPLFTAQIILECGASCIRRQRFHELVERSETHRPRTMDRMLFSPSCGFFGVL